MCREWFKVYTVHTAEAEIGQSEVVFTAEIALFDALHLRYAQSGVDEENFCTREITALVVGAAVDAEAAQ